MTSGPLVWPTDRVIGALVHAVTSTNPRKRYVVGIDARLYMVPAMALPHRVYLWIIRKVTGADKLVPAGGTSDKVSSSSRKAARLRAK